MNKNEELFNYDQCQVDTNQIENFGLMMLLLISLEGFYNAGADERKTNIKEYLNNENKSKRIIDLITKENKGIFKSWRFVFEQNINNLLSLACNISRIKNNNDFLIDVIQSVIDWHKDDNFEISKDNLENFVAVLSDKVKVKALGRQPKDFFEDCLSIVKPAVVAGVLIAGKGYIQSNAKDPATKIKSSEDVYSITSDLCCDLTGRDTVRKNCFEKRNSEGAKLRKIVSGHASQLFRKLQPGETVPLPTLYEIYMVMFRVVTLNENLMWTGKLSEDGIPLLRNIGSATI